MDFGLLSVFQVRFMLILTFTLFGQRVADSVMENPSFVHIVRTAAFFTVAAVALLAIAATAMRRAMIS